MMRRIGHRWNWSFNMGEGSVHIHFSLRLFLVHLKYNEMRMRILMTVLNQLYYLFQLSHRRRQTMKIYKAPMRQLQAGSQTITNQHHNLFNEYVSDGIDSYRLFPPKWRGQM
mmetsp:Transcript_22659/g.35642  ORF Transcript_22659/g.35642 Transcript_22659/m.35642 type:complete len:112 (-) Transcript_22659:1584-1919(-)